VSESFESAYAYARVCGSLARSFLGTRTSALAASHRVGEAWRAIFDEAPPALPEGELATAAERGVRFRAHDALMRIAGPLLKEEPFFAALVRKWEFSYLKSLLSAIVERAPEAPAVDDPSLHADFDVGGYPDLGSMLKKTRYRWVIESGLQDLPAVKNRLDRQYYAELWDALEPLPPALAGGLPELLRVEAELENVCWALRLKRYYSMSAAEIEPLLIELRGKHVKARALEAAAKKADSRSEWAAWKWEKLIPEARGGDGGEWRFDVRGFEAEARAYLFRRLYRRLHLEIDSYVPLYAYFRIKEYETTALHGIIEGIKLEAPAAEIASFAMETTGGRP
jgi:vacuolar-type H+-ATPase subunit C/Vma6